MQLEFKGEEGAAVKTATVKAGGGDTETLPLYSNKQTIAGEVGAVLQCWHPSGRCSCLSTV